MVATVVAQEDYEKWLKNQQQAQQQAFEDETRDFQNYVAEVTAQYDAYEQQQAKEFEEFKEAVEEKWHEFKYPSKKVYVDYDEDLDSRASVDFENGEIIIEVIVMEDQPEERVKEAEEAKADAEPREKLVDKQLAKKMLNLIKTKADDGKPLLQGQIADKKGKTVKESDAESFAAESVQEKPVAKKTYKAKDGKKRTVYSVKVPMKSDHINTRANQYKQEVIKQSKRFNIDPIIAFAVMETESAFNPKAKSHIPAFGLMQLVPRSGARDAYLYVYKDDKFVDDKYLYIPSNNVELGCAYLSKIRHHYFKSITDDERAYICAIPAYNTGIGNVAKALTNTTKLKPAAQKANSMSADQLYKKLIKDLKYKEARDYLERVWTRKDKYVNLIK
jgi:membrane-bound lytic murein transglycosylase C|tara:strand:+ start:410 stop:1576 length:1167 start_codon:yes stop_codon:yes gene_type:complete